MGNSGSALPSDEKSPSSVAAGPSGSVKTAPTGETGKAVPPPPIRWRVWPLWDKPLRGVAVLAALAIVGFVAEWAIGQPYLGLIVAAALTASIWRFFVPVVFELDRGGVSRQCFGRRYRISWNTIGLYEILPDGVLLLPHADACPLDVARGLFLPWGGRREEVSALVEFYLRRGT